MNKFIQDHNKDLDKDTSKYYQRFNTDGGYDDADDIIDGQ